MVINPVPTSLNLLPRLTVRRSYIASHVIKPKCYECKNTATGKRVRYFDILEDAIVRVPSQYHQVQYRDPPDSCFASLVQAHRLLLPGLLELGLLMFALTAKETKSPKKR